MSNEKSLLQSRRGSIRKLKHTVNKVSSLRDCKMRLSVSRRDKTLLTVGFSLRRGTTTSPIVPQGRHYQVSPLRGEGRVWWIVRRLKPTVNKVLSLRDNDSHIVQSRAVRRLKPTVNKVLSLRDIGKPCKGGTLLTVCFSLRTLSLRDKMLVGNGQMSRRDKILVENAHRPHLIRAVGTKYLCRCITFRPYGTVGCGGWISVSTNILSLRDSPSSPPQGGAHPVGMHRSVENQLSPHTLHPVGMQPHLQHTVASLRDAGVVGVRCFLPSDASLRDASRTAGGFLAEWYTQDIFPYK